MRAIASALLVVSAVVYLATLQWREIGPWGFINAAAEGAMVGGLADWFAVTALFKHPMGLPIPHTAIIPKRKDEIGRSLEEFVSANFLTESVVAARLAEIDVPTRLGEWLADEGHRHRALTEATRVGSAALDAIGDDDVAAFLGGALLPRLAEEPISPIAGSLLAGVLADGSHRGLVDLVVRELRDWVAANPGTFRNVVAERAPWWSPPWLDERVIDWGYQQVLDWLADIERDPNHKAKQALDGLLETLADDLQHDPDVMERAEALKGRLLSHPQVQTSLIALWRSLRDSVSAAMADQSSYLWQRGDELLAHASTRLIHDPQWRDRLERGIADATRFVINTYGDEIVSVISTTVNRWDSTETSRRVELYVGRDLQFIRINGTVVGAIAGLAIHGVAVGVMG